MTWQKFKQPPVTFCLLIKLVRPRQCRTIVRRCHSKKSPSRQASWISDSLRNRYVRHDDEICKLESQAAASGQRASCTAYDLLMTASYRRFRSSHDFSRPTVSLLLFRILEYPCSPNRLATTRNSSQKPLPVHFHSQRRQVRHPINI